MGSRDLQKWMHIGAMNRSWFLTLPNALRAAMDSLSANFIGGKGRGEMALWFMKGVTQPAISRQIIDMLYSRF